MQSSRRDFFKKLVTIVGVGAVAPSLFASAAQAAEERRRPRPGAAGAAAGAAGPTDLPLVKPGEGMAVSLNYVIDKGTIKDAALKADRSGVKWDAQHCNGCQLYSKVGTKDGGEVGKCQLFAGQLVKGNAWCASWSKKA